MDGAGRNLRFFRFLNEGQNYIFNFYSHAEKLVMIMPVSASHWQVHACALTGC